LAKKGETNEENAFECRGSGNADDTQHSAVIGRLLLASLASLASLLRSPSALLLLQWHPVPWCYLEGRLVRLISADCTMCLYVSDQATKKLKR
jgi:hypothetical protein